MGFNSPFKGLIFERFLKSVEKIHVVLKSDKKNEYFPWRRNYIYDIMLISSRIRNVSDKIFRESHNKFYVQ